MVPIFEYDCWSGHWEVSVAVGVDRIFDSEVHGHPMAVGGE